MITVKTTKKYGRGVYALKELNPGDTITTNRLAIGEDGGGLLDRYAFEYNSTNCAIALGSISLVNHSKRPNAAWVIKRGMKNPVIVLFAVKKIPLGDQIFINYGYEPDRI